ncbi:MAG: hypothetical protein R2991_05295 [Thermoanaerobaculia bacterium]
MSRPVAVALAVAALAPVAVPPLAAAEPPAPGTASASLSAILETLWSHRLETTPTRSMLVYAE